MDENVESLLGTKFEESYQERIEELLSLLLARLHREKEKTDELIISSFYLFFC